MYEHIDSYEIVNDCPISNVSFVKANKLSLKSKY